ncbi:MAG: T9SS type A sorting domain-containing protein, partial [Cytophagales bacterium]|nr:T9SS type A sorting domain-containing protein [Cytophagales bacterium]
NDYANWLSKVSDKTKLVIGLPSYGYKWVGNTSTGSSSQPYKTIINQYPRGVTKDSIRPASGQVIYYNGVTTIKNKTNYALSNAGGVMMWTLQFDLPTSDPNSLLLAISQVRTTSLESSEIPFLSTQVFPNPFDHQTTCQFTIEKPSNTQIEITNTQGLVVQTLTNQWLDAGSYTLETDLANLLAGVYFLTIRTPYEKQTVRLVKL